MGGPAGVDFDHPEGLKVARQAYWLARDYQEPRLKQYTRNNNLYMGFKSTSGVNTDLANIHWMKMFNDVETIVPRYVKATHARRPYIPLQAVRKDDQVSMMTSRLIAEYADQLLHRSGFVGKRILQEKLAVVHGTAFMEPLPYYELVEETQPVRDMTGQPVVGPDGRPMTQEVQAYRFRIGVNVYAPWEVFVSPYSMGLEQKGQCRYLVIVQLVSKREITKLAQQGAYPNLDIEQLTNYRYGQGMEYNRHWGIQMLQDMGLARPEHDTDLAVLIRYMSDERYIDVLDGEVLLRDIANPYKHGRINLARLIHTQIPHTQDAFWGLGVIKPNEVQAAVFDDIGNAILNNAAYQLAPVTYYDPARVQRESLFRTLGNRIPVDTQGGQIPIKNVLEESPGTPLPPQFFQILDYTERMMDLTTGNYDMTRGEPSEKQGTATEKSILSEAGNIRLEMGVRQDEIFLSSFGELCLENIAQGTQAADFVEILGPEKAMQLLTNNANKIPGGYEFDFKGSDRIVNMLQRQRNLKEATPLVLQILQTLDPGAWEWGKEFLNAHECEDIAEKIFDPQRLQMLQQQMMQQQQQEQQQEQEKGAVEHKQKLELEGAKARYKANTTKQEAQSSGQEYVRR